METKDTLYFIAHTHWEGAVFKTRDQYLEIGLPIILQVLRLMKDRPDYRFTLDQACYIQPFLERYPEEVATFRRFVQEGRLAIVGGTDVMLDVNMPGGESFIRQVLYGKGYFRKQLGVDVTTSWQLDTFGHHAQMPQLLKLAGYHSFWFFRGVPSWETPSEFAWEGLDGSRIPAFWLPNSYANVYGSPHTLPEFTETMEKAYDALAPFARGEGRVGLAGADVCEPEPHVPLMIDRLNQQPDRPFNMQLAVPADYEAVVARRGELPVVGGELNPIFQGIYSSRIELKQRTRELEMQLTTAEKLGALLSTQGEANDDAQVWRAWEPMLFNQAHDLMSGVMTDGVYEDSMRGYDFSKRLADELVDTRLQAISERIDTQGAGIPLIVFNALGASRTDIALATVGFSDIGIEGVALTGPDGKPVPCQLLEQVRAEGGGSLLQAQVAFVARDVPALGHAVYHLQPLTTVAPGQIAEAVEAPVLENDLYRLDIDAASGAITGLMVKDGNWHAISGPANVIAMEEDNGDFWELYRPLDAASRIGMTGRHEPPQPGNAVFSTEQGESAGTVTRGSVVSEFTVTHPFGEKGRFRTTIRLYAGLPRVEIRTIILNHEKFVRYRSLFPTTLRQGQRTDEIPFGAIARPDGIEFPAQNWVDLSADNKGMALLNRGLPGNNIAGDTLLLSLMRSTEIVSYGHGGGFEGQGSTSGFELGKELAFDYALLPHAGDWRQAALYHEGQAFNQPFIARTATAHAGPLPARWGLLAISQDNVVVSTLKTGAKGQLVLRIYEAAGMAVDDVSLTFAGKLTAAEELNLMEDSIQPLNAHENTLNISLRPFEIKTIGLCLCID